jgi:hypothetical protein
MVEIIKWLDEIIVEGRFLNECLCQRNCSV